MNLDARHRQIVGRSQAELRLAAAEQLVEAARKGVLERRERTPELVVDEGAQRADQLARRG